MADVYGTTVSELQAACHRIAVEHGWWEDSNRPIAEQLMNWHAEVDEAWEEYRVNDDLRHVYFINRKPEGFGIEAADLVIRIMDTCEFYGIALEDLIVMKMSYNETRDYRHGGKNA
jgi:hypothetical protein